MSSWSKEAASQSTNGQSAQLFFCSMMQCPSAEDQYSFSGLCTCFRAPITNAASLKIKENHRKPVPKCFANVRFTQIPDSSKMAAASLISSRHRLANQIMRVPSERTWPKCLNTPATTGHKTKPLNGLAHWHRKNWEDFRLVFSIAQGTHGLLSVLAPQSFRTCASLPELPATSALRFKSLSIYLNTKRTLWTLGQVLSCDVLKPGFVALGAVRPNVSTDLSLAGQPNRLLPEPCSLFWSQACSNNSTDSFLQLPAHCGFRKKISRWDCNRLPKIINLDGCPDPCASPLQMLKTQRKLLPYLGERDWKGIKAAANACSFHVSPSLAGTNQLDPDSAWQCPK